MFLPPDASTILSNTDKHNLFTSIDERKRQLRKTRSHDSLLAPLVRLTRDPIGALGSIVESFRNEEAEERGWEAAEKERERGILYLRLKTVGLCQTYRRA